MKTIISIISLITFLAVNSYSQNSEVNTLLEKPEIRKEIFNIILNSHYYMTEFIQAMHGNQHAMMMVNGNNQVNGDHKIMGNSGQMGMNGSNQMMDRNNMMNMMHQSPEMMQMMMGNMMDVVATDSTMCHRMVNLMTSHPQMMQMMMNKFNNNMNSGTTIGNKIAPAENRKANMGQTHQH